jgi:sigma-B regulation protein RsbU (phosphoserine phosphatase)
MMQKSVMRMASLIDNVLDFARGRLGGGIALTLSTLPLTPVLQQVVHELQSAHPERLIKTLDKLVTADPVRIGQLFSNILSNALTYGTEGEPVTVIGKRKNSLNSPFAIWELRFQRRRWSDCSSPSRVAR